jgi:hypothetical protein
MTAITKEVFQMGRYSDTDTQREKLYDAQNVLSAYSEKFESIEECFDYISKIIRRKSFVIQFPRAYRNLKPYGGKRKERWNDRRYYGDEKFHHHKVYGQNQGIWISFGNKSGGSYWQTSDNRIQLSRNHWNEHICIHELCHAIIHYEFRSRTAWHGREFCNTYLWVVRKVMGKEAHDALKASFQKHGVIFALPFRMAA